jgi:NAD(P)-dependent dehydrogenase (short-subunit alcohol dehydrogenase family)
VACSGDVSKLEDVQRMVKTAVDFGGKLDVLVSNAGIDVGGTTITELDPEIWRKMLDINLTGPFLVMRTAIPEMIKAGGGSIVTIASLAGLRCLPGMPGYCTTKAGLIMLTQQAALDFGPSKIRCNAVCPGATGTEMLKNSLAPLAQAIGTDVQGVFDRIMASVPLRRVASAEEIAGTVGFLASDEASFITGAVISVDGGAAIVDVSGAALSNVGVKWGVAETGK